MILARLVALINDSTNIRATTASVRMANSGSVGSVCGNVGDSVTIAYSRDSANSWYVITNGVLSRLKRISNDLVSPGLRSSSIGSKSVNEAATTSPFPS